MGFTELHSSSSLVWHSAQTGRSILEASDLYQRQQGVRERRAKLPPPSHALAVVQYIAADVGTQKRSAERQSAFDRLRQGARAPTARSWGLRTRDPGPTRVLLLYTNGPRALYPFLRSVDGWRIELYDYDEQLHVAKVVVVAAVVEPAAGGDATFRNPAFVLRNRSMLPAPARPAPDVD